MGQDDRISQSMYPVSRQGVSVRVLMAGYQRRMVVEVGLPAGAVGIDGTPLASQLIDLPLRALH